MEQVVKCHFLGSTDWTETKSDSQYERIQADTTDILSPGPQEVYTDRIQIYDSKSTNTFGSTKT